MKRIRIICVSTAILLGVGGAWATRPCFNCELYQQYHFTGAGYDEVLDYGYDYYCQQFSGTCTYYRPNPFMPNYYAPCRQGIFTPL